MNIIRKIGEGNTAEIFLLEDGRILKLFRDGIAREGIEREYENSKIASEYISNVPKVFELVEDKGRVGIIFQRIEGTDMMQLIVSHPFLLIKYMRAFSEYHTRITETMVEDSMRTLEEKIRDEIGWENDLSNAEKRKVYDYLSKLPGGNSLCHCDFHPGNVMMNKENAFFLDWMTACKGNACADAARTFLLLRYGEPMHLSFARLMVVRLAMILGANIYLQEYCRLTGIKKEAIKQWMLPVMTARLSEWLTDGERKKLLKRVRSLI